jgi:SAM-dependent methyltransferase
MLPPGGRGRELLGRAAGPLPRTVQRRLRTALLRLDHRREERRTAREVAARETDPRAVAGLPVPPPLLRVRVTGSHSERNAWLASSVTDARLIRELLGRNGAELERMEAILDFGCGCGRIARHWVDLDGPAIHGADVSRAATRWCRRNLPFMRTTLIRREPPLPYGDARFDFAYAISVFTHLPEETGRRWFTDLVRVLKPGGLLLFTVHGERFLGELDEEGASRFRRGRSVVVDRPPVLAGTNQFAAFHPPEYVKRELLPALDVELVEAVYEDPTGAGKTPMPLQDNYLVRRRAQ